MNLARVSDGSGSPERSEDFSGQRDGDKNLISAQKPIAGTPTQDKA